MSVRDRLSATVQAGLPLMWVMICITTLSGFKRKKSSLQKEANRNFSSLWRSDISGDAGTRSGITFSDVTCTATVNLEKLPAKTMNIIYRYHSEDFPIDRSEME